MLFQLNASDPLSPLEICRIAAVPCRAVVDGGAAAGILRDLGAYVDGSELLDEVGGVVAAIGAQHDPERAVGMRLDHPQRGKPLEMA